MTHTQFIKSNFKVLAETDNAIFFDAYGELCCEIKWSEFPLRKCGRVLCDGGTLWGRLI